MLDKPQLQKLSRFIFEDEMRRNLQRQQKEALTDQEAIDYFLPQHAQFLQNLTEQKRQAMLLEVTALMEAQGEAYEPYAELSLQLRTADLNLGGAGAAEEAKQTTALQQVSSAASPGVPGKVESLDTAEVLQLVEDYAASQPW